MISQYLSRNHVNSPLSCGLIRGYHVCSCHLLSHVEIEPIIWLHNANTVWLMFKFSRYSASTNPDTLPQVDARTCNWLYLAAVRSRHATTVSQSAATFERHEHPNILAIRSRRYIRWSASLWAMFKSLSWFLPYQDLTPVPYAVLTRPQSELTRRTMVQHNLTHCLRDPVSWRKMTPHCSVSLRIPMAQGRYLDVFFCPGFCLKASPTRITWLRVQAGPTNKPGIIVYVRDFHGYPSLRAAYARLTRALRKKTLP